jgi:cold shock protein
MDRVNGRTNSALCAEVPRAHGHLPWERLYRDYRSSSRHALILRCRAGCLLLSSKYRCSTRKVRAGHLVQETAMNVGTVKFFNAQKGFGFIAHDGGGKDVFVHISAVERSGLSGLNDGQKVSFDLEKDRQGRDSAINLKAA